jgi:hypothetical protein
MPADNQPTCQGCDRPVSKSERVHLRSQTWHTDATAEHQLHPGAWLGP